MKTNRVLSAFFVISLTFVNCFAKQELASTLNEASLAKMAAATLSFSKLNWNNLYVTASFYNDIIQFIMLSNRFEDDPESAQKIAHFFEYKINNDSIPLNEEKKLGMRKDIPFTVSLVTAPRQITPLVAFIKMKFLNNNQETFADKVKFMCLKILDFLSFKVSFECPIEENGDHFYSIAELFAAHEEVSKFLNGEKNFSDMIKKERISWPAWFDVTVKLPRLRASR